MGANVSIFGQGISPVRMSYNPMQIMNLQFQSKATLSVTIYSRAGNGGEGTPAGPALHVPHSESHPGREGRVTLKQLQSGIAVKMRALHGWSEQGTRRRAVLTRVRWGGFWVEVRFERKMRV